MCVCVMMMMVMMIDSCEYRIVVSLNSITFQILLQDQITMSLNI